MIKKETNKNNPAEAKKMLSALNQTLKEGQPCYLAYGLTEGHMDSLYESASNLYFKKDYRESMALFNQLAMLNQLDPRGFLGMGLCFHRLEKYDDAVAWYLLSAAIDPNEKVLFSAVDCLVALKNYPEAIKTLDIIIALPEVIPNSPNLKKEAEEAKMSLLQLV